jgi:hypothetical protein
MNKTIAFCIVYLVLIMMAAANAEQAGPCQITVLTPNADLLPNPTVKSGETLFGLYKTDLGYVLLPSKVLVESAVDSRCRKIMRVRVEDENQPLFLVSGPPSLRAGKVKTIFAGDKFLFPGESFTLRNDEQGASGIEQQDSYILRAFGRAEDRFKKYLIYDYTMKMARGHRIQTLEYYRATDDSHSTAPSKYAVLDVTDPGVRADLDATKRLPVLLWAGDVDRDEKPDLFMWWPCPGKDAGVYSLFLSSMAKDGELVAKNPVIVRVPPEGCR